MAQQLKRISLTIIFTSVHEIHHRDNSNSNDKKMAMTQFGFNISPNGTESEFDIITGEMIYHLS